MAETFLPDLSAFSADRIISTLFYSWMPMVFEVKGIGGIPNNIRLDVNPSQISLTRNPIVSSIQTREGIINNFWRPAPDVLSISGQAAGTRSASVLIKLKQVMDSLQSSATNISNIVKLKYKGRSYRGWINNFTISVNAENPKIFPYSFNFNFASNNDTFNYVLLSRKAGMESFEENERELAVEAAKIAGDAISSLIPAYVDTAEKVIETSGMGNIMSFANI